MFLKFLTPQEISAEVPPEVPAVVPLEIPVGRLPEVSVELPSSSRRSSSGNSCRSSFQSF